MKISKNQLTKLLDVKNSIIEPRTEDSNHTTFLTLEVGKRQKGIELEVYRNVEDGKYVFGGSILIRSMRSDESTRWDFIDNAETVYNWLLEVLDGDDIENPSDESLEALEKAMYRKFNNVKNKK